MKPMYWSTEADRDEYEYVDTWEPTVDANHAIEFLRNEGKKGDKPRDANEPWGLVVATNPPHSPYNQVPDKYKQVYADMPMKRFTQSPAVRPAGSKWGKFYRKRIRNYLAMITGVDRQHLEDRPLRGVDASAFDHAPAGQARTPG